MKLYTLTRLPNGTLHLTAQAEVIDKDQRGRTTGMHIETEITSKGIEAGNTNTESKALALAIMRHYYGASDKDAGATAQAAEKAKAFHEAFLIHAKVPKGGKVEISSLVIDKFFSIR